VNNLRQDLDSVLIDPESHTEYRLHAVKRIFERGISRTCVSDIIKMGVVIESYPDDQPFPSCLILGRCQGRPFHVVIGLNKEGKTIHVITVYEPSLEYWDNEYRSRK